MTLFIPNAGEVVLLQSALQTTTPEALTLKLYTNNYDAVAGSTAGNFTEAAGSNYAAKTLTRGTWGTATGGQPSTSVYGSAQTWTFNGAITIVGYFIVGSSSGTIYWAERIYAGAGQLFNNTDTLTITPKFALT